jgi:dTDP-4-amino-4,6-dideoxygalactose transaminase
MVKIPFCELVPDPTEREEFTQIAAQVLRSGRYINGPEVSAFETEVAAYLEVGFAVGVNSGTDALLIALQAAGVRAGDEVITSPFTFFATAEVIARLGAVPVFVDIDLDTYCLSAKAVEAAITPKTRAIIPVHLYGHAAPMAELVSLAQTNRLALIEDAAQAFGGGISGRKVGGFGTAGAFSFFPTKNLGAFGDGGLLTTHDEGFAARARALRVHGMVQKFHPEELGYNSRLDELQAAFLRKKLTRLDAKNRARIEAAGRYSQLLAGVSALALPTQRAGVKHVYHLYTVRVTRGREALQASLQKAGIDTAIYYQKPLHLLPLFEKYYKPLPNVEAASQQVLSLPFWPEISAEAQAQVAAQLIKSIEQ